MATHFFHNDSSSSIVVFSSIKLFFWKFHMVPNIKINEVVKFFVLFLFYFRSGTGSVNETIVPSTQQPSVLYVLKIVEFLVVKMDT